MIYNPKSQPAPICLDTEKLKANGNHSCGDVLTRLQDDFSNKCYLCEEKEPSTINLEHFIPHQGDIDLRFDWDNLFYACGHCNNIKLAKHTNLLNSTIEADNVETNFHYHINPFPKEKANLTAIASDIRIINTVALLNDIYNGNTIHKTIEAGNIRAKLLKEVRNFQDLLFQYYDDSYDKEELVTVKQKIERELRRTSAFTAFKRWVIRDNADLFADFGMYLF